jgi:hypothetical protein
MLERNIVLIIARAMIVIVSVIAIVFSVSNFIKESDITSIFIIISAILSVIYSTVSFFNQIEVEDKAGKPPAGKPPQAQPRA